MEDAQSSIFIERTKMKYLIAAATVAAFSTSAFAAELSTTIGAERKTEAETNHLYTDITVSEGALASTLGFNWADTAEDNGDFNFTTAEIDFSYTINETVTLYVNNDFNDDFKHTETVVGGKVKF